MNPEDVLLVAQAKVRKHLQDAKLTYAQAYRRAREELHATPDAVTLPTSAWLDDWLRPERHGWYAEPPTHGWYAGALAARALGAQFSEVLTQRLMDAANYYGDSDLVLEIFRDIPAETASAFRCDLLKQVAKAHKNAGAFELARKCYREALELAHRDNSVALVTYFLLLYAKLCDHYEQRIAWHRAFHRIAHTRLQHIDILGQCDDDRLPRWMRISEDALAKAIYDTHPDEAEALFARALQRCDVEEDSYLRVAWHRAEARILRQIGGADINVGVVAGELQVLDRLIDLARRLQNDRALNVRRVLQLRLVRMVCERMGPVLPEELSEIDSVRELLNGESLIIAGETLAWFSRLDDRRGEAIAVFERGKWRGLVSGRQSAKVIEDLEQARARLTNAPDVMFDLYYDMALALAEQYQIEGKWAEAEMVYVEVYDYCNKLADRIDLDDRRLPIDTPDAPPELRLLSADERDQLAHELRRDYRVLLKRALKVGERLRMPKQELRNEAVRRYMQREAVYHHALMSRLTAGFHPKHRHDGIQGLVRTIEDRRASLPLKDSERIDERTSALRRSVDAELQHMVATLDAVDPALHAHQIEDLCATARRFAQEARALDSPDTADLLDAIAVALHCLDPEHVFDRVKGEIDDLLIGLQRADYANARLEVEVCRELRTLVGTYPQVDVTALQGRSVRVRFHPDILALFVTGALGNASQAAARAGRRDYHVWLNVHLRDDNAFLWIEDDAGELEGLVAAIDQVNELRRPFSRRSGDGGRGLLGIRNYMIAVMKISDPWSVRVEGCRAGCKALVVPLGALVQGVVSS
jgi:tetratricopeptide (TPR) repeat protein